MIRSVIKILFQHKRQAIKKLDETTLPANFKGVPILSSKNLNDKKLQEAINMCPTNALNNDKFSLDMGKCIF